MKMQTAVVVVLLSLVAGCSSTLNTTGDSGEVLVFAVPQDIAYTILRDSITPVAREGTVQRISSPHNGYSGDVKLGLDTDTIKVVMIPARGRNSMGEVLDGYRFDVVHSGTAAMARVPAARDIRRNITRNAVNWSEPLTLVE